MDEGRWKALTPSAYDHEREALDHVKTHLPETEPYRAWSNFTFTADTGHTNEVDLFVAAPRGLYLIEIKSLRGQLTSSGSDWLLHRRSGSLRTFQNPYHLADLKAKRLKTMLRRAHGKLGVTGKIPFVQAAVFLSVPSLRVELASHHLHEVYGPEGATGPLPGIVSGLLTRPAADYERRVTPSLSRQLEGLLRECGIAPSRKRYQVGSWELEPKPIEEGPHWQDHLAEHRDLPRERRRVRIYLVERRAAKDERASIERAARREMAVLHGISHPGIVQVDAMEQHESGPALVFRHEKDSMRLDQYITQHGNQLDVDTRIRMVRDLAEAIQHVHSRRLHHRALSARSVLVTRGKGKGDQGWRRPQLQLSDWQVATRAAAASGGTAGSLEVLATSHVEAHVGEAAQSYLAPEFDNPEADPVALDVFGLGALTYLLLSGEPPAGTRTELLARLAADNGLRPSANADSVSEFMDELVQAATAPRVEQRLTTATEFLELLTEVEDELTAPSAHASEPAGDLLEAKPGDVFDEWTITRRLGTGSTSRAFLAERDGHKEVLKVALSDAKVSRLQHEAQVLAPLMDSRVIRLAREEPVRIGGRWALVLEHVEDATQERRSDPTLARKLRDDGRLTVDELETYSEYLFGALDYLEGEGVYHRDIKPDNIAIRVRPNRTRQLVLFDFSLAGVSVKELQAGTPRYLDPFIGTTPRPVYDRHAEWYALAVTLHEMASGELPVWGDGVTEPRFTEGPPVLAAEAFDPAIRDGLASFFVRALDRDAARRFESLKEMRNAWLQVFAQSDRTAPVGSAHPATDEDEEASPEVREAAAAAATPETPLDASGLTPRAVSAAQRLEAVTVGDLLNKAPTLLFKTPGLGAKTRRELQQRVKQWRARLHVPTASPGTKVNRDAAKEEVDRAHGGELRTVGLDAIAALLTPAATSSNTTTVQAIRLLLRLPDDSGALPDLAPWPTQPAVAKAIGVTPGRVAQILTKQRKRWHDEPVMLQVRQELIEMLADSGRVMGAAELAASLLARRGCAQDDEAARLAVALAAVRAGVEVDALEGQRRLLTRRHSDPDRLLIALEVDDQEESADTPAGPALLDYADALGQAADRLAGMDVLPSPGTVMRVLAEAPAGPGISLSERRLVRLAAAASRHAAASPRLEIYPRELDLVRALRLAQAGVVSPELPGDDSRRSGVRPEDVKARVRARFPDMTTKLPDHPVLHRLLGEAGFELRYRDGRYLPPQRDGSAATPSLRRRSTRAEASPWTAESPELAAAAHAEQRLTSDSNGFRALTVRRNRYTRARNELSTRFDARPLSVAGLFVEKLRELVDARPKPTWATVLDADNAEPGSRPAIKLAEYAERAWRLAEPELRAALGGAQAAGPEPGEPAGPLLLHDAAVFSRYRAMELLYELAAEARAGAGALWLLCPMEDPGQLPKLDGAAVQVVTENEWIVLPDAWIANQHRSGEAAS